MIKLNVDIFQPCGKREHLLIQFLQPGIAAPGPEAITAKTGHRKSSYIKMHKQHRQKLLFQSWNQQKQVDKLKSS